ncbi:MAG: DUF2017 domain-containing protein [Cryobacterium sp.]|nr:DUF2017 domain-containing protein [Micrococcales bacterium]MBX3078270.1 DUF2017 domain-containing protein [Cryobacterium sp.]MBX3309213.1 DUF2017 domain-containing protein [Cryobacterium sp.]MCB1281284.1 DUF2017 domain-containing protein [Salinibacterium sp.]HNP15525.1 DUF2017 domain-containing protein [Terrimesophilobacter sp.]
MKAFAARDDGVIVAAISRDEALLLQNLASQVSVLLREGNANDPAVIRMLPDAYPGDPASSAEFRRYTASGLIDRKVSNADVVIVTLSAAIDSGEVTLDRGQAQAWLRSLTDIRLSLASRLGIESDDQEPNGDGVLQGLYDWLGFLQNSLVEAVGG